MANFSVKTRLNHLDISGMVLDLRPDGLIEDPDNPGFMSKWVNQAPPRAAPRLGDALPAIASGGGPIPIESFGGGNVARFNDTSFSQWLEIASTGTFPSSQKFAAAFIWDNPSGVVSANQYLWGFGSVNFDVFRNDAANLNYGYSHNATVVSATPTKTTQEALLQFEGAGTANLFDPLTASLPAALAGTASDIQIPGDQSNAVYWGRRALGQLSASRLYSFKIWDRLLSPLEVDFFYHTGALISATSQSEFDRADMRLQTWNDDTGDINLNQYSRVNPRFGLPQRFEIATGLNKRVQFACEVDGHVLPDSDLGGDLFAVTFIETAGATTPVIYQDAGWSSIFDLSFISEGHYTIAFTRPNGGTKIVHIDVEA